MADYDVYDHRDLQATCLDVDATAQHLALVGKRYLAITSAIDPEKYDVKHARRGRYEVGCVRWCPCETNRNYLATTSSQYFELYAMQPGSVTVINSVRAHTRVVTDLDWDHYCAYRLATCSVDDNAYVWDFRDLKKPALTLNVVAGANQIKWARLLENICATAHESDVRIWDIRKGSTPVQYISAHLAKVTSLDWHPRNDVQLVSSSQDCRIKLWDFTKPSKPEAECTLLTPVWKAKFAPFGNGLLTIPTPNVAHVEHALTLWNCNDFSSAVHSFLGHTDLILDLCWRQPPETESRDIVHVISLSKDHTVRVWNIDARTQQLCEQRRSTPDIAVNGLSNDLGILIETMDRTSIDAGLVVNRGRPDIDWQHEFSGLSSINMPKILLEEINEDTKTAIISVENPKDIIRLSLHFPMDSSSGSQLSFQFSRDTTIPSAVRVIILKQLQEICEQQPANTGHQSILESCLTRLVNVVEQILGVEQPVTNADGNSLILQSPQVLQSPSILASFLDARVPFPRTTGAHFNAVGILVCFGRCDFGESNQTPTPTPRSYSALASFAREPRSYFTIKNTDYSLKSYYQREWRTSRKHLSPNVKLRTREELEESSSELFVYDGSGLLPLHKDLAANYCYPETSVQLVDVCLKNANAAASVGRRDLVQAWTVLSYCVAPSLTLSNTAEADGESPWAAHPFGRTLVLSLIDHLAKIGDVQSAATICCVLGKRPRYCIQERPCSRMSAASESGNGNSPYNTVHGSDVFSEAWKGYLKRQRSGSCSEEGSYGEPVHSSAEPLSHTETNKSSTVLSERDFYEKNMKLLDPDFSDRFEAIKQAYADILFRWGMLNERACILKYSNRPPDRFRTMEFLVQCKRCDSECRTPICNNCREYVMTCAICQNVVKGLCSVCLLCNHGGHTLHLASWFSTQKKCPTGCGCVCVLG